MSSVFELYVSLGSASGDKSYDMYTAVDHDQEQMYSGSGEFEHHSAVGITSGLAAVDRSAQSKALREKHFPMARLTKGLTFKCMEGKASVTSDEDRIKGEIAAEANGAEHLDDAVHGLVALSQLVRGLEAGDETAKYFMDAIRKGEVRMIRIALEWSAADTQETVSEVVEALASSPSAATLEELELVTDEATMLPER